MTEQNPRPPKAHEIPPEGCGMVMVVETTPERSVEEIADSKGKGDHIIMSRRELIELLQAERQKREEEAKEVDGNELAKWLHKEHENLGPYIWQECCRVYGSGGTPEASFAYKKIVLAVKEALTQPNNPE